MKLLPKNIYIPEKKKQGKTGIFKKDFTYLREREQEWEQGQRETQQGSQHRA